MRSLDLIPAKWLDYEPPGLCHAGAAAIVPVISAVAGIGGTVLSAEAQRRQADYEQKLAQVQNEELQQKGNQDAAAAERAQIAENRRTQLTESRVQALAAASGGAATDTGVINLEGQIAKQGSYNALSALYNGQAQRQADVYQGQIDLFQGQQAVGAAPMTALGTVLGGIGRFVGNHDFLSAISPMPPQPSDSVSFPSYLFRARQP